MVLSNFHIHKHHPVHHHDRLDHIWGGFVVAATIFNYAIASSVVFAVYVFYTDLVEAFESDFTTVGWIMSLNAASKAFAGILASALTKVYGCRPIAILGGLITALGIGASAFAPNVYFLYGSFGVVAGTGVAFVFIPSTSIVQQYFHRHRPLAAGLSVTGLCLGNLIFAPVNRVLIDYYGWRGCFIMMAGFSLNICVVASVFRTPHQLEKHPVDVTKKVVAKLEKEKIPIVVAQPKATRAHANGQVNEENQITRRVLDKEKTNDLQVNPPHKKIKFESQLSTEPKDYKGLKEFVDKFKDEESHHYHHTPHFHLPHFHMPHLHKPHLHMPHLHMPHLHKPHLHMPHWHLPHWHFHHRHGLGFRHYGPLGDLCLQMWDFSLFRHVSFLMFCLGTLLFITGSVSFISQQINRAIEDGATKQEAALLPTIYAVGNLIARVVFSIEIDRLRYNGIYQYGLGILFAGIIAVLSTLNSGYKWLMVVAALIGTCQGTTICVQSTVLVDLLGVERIAQSFALLQIFVGFGAVGGVSVSGWLFDLTKNFSYVYYFGGSCQILGGLCILGITVFERQKVKNRFTIETPSGYSDHQMEAVGQVIVTDGVRHGSISFLHEDFVKPDALFGNSNAAFVLNEINPDENDSIQGDILQDVETRDDSDPNKSRNPELDESIDSRVTEMGSDKKEDTSNVLQIHSECDNQQTFDDKMVTKL